MNRTRGTTTSRGYGTNHQRTREQWAPYVATGTVPCWRCGEVIRADEPWDLGHDDHDRRKYKGPEHRKCNRNTMSAEARARRAGTDPKPQPRTRW